MILRIVPAALAAAALTGAPSAHADTIVTAGSPASPFTRNKQNEPAIAVDPTAPNVLVAGANDQIDFEACAAGDPMSCTATRGVGDSGVYFSFDGGMTWTQPTYTGLTARACSGPASCAPAVGKIGTLPFYYETGLWSGGDPGLVFGPRPDREGRFSWANGSRLYYSNVAFAVSTARTEVGPRTAAAIAVSRTDDVHAAAESDQGAWLPPVVVSNQNPATAGDKPAIWADNAASSRFFGNVYVCQVSFHGSSPGGFSEPLFFLRSTDGGDTWSSNRLTDASGTAHDVGHAGEGTGCAIRTDSKGVVYLFWWTRLFGQEVQVLTRSFDGGVHFEKPRPIAVVAPCGTFDPNQGRLTFDGVAGARTNSFPSVDIANGAPSGEAATNRIVMTWCDAGEAPDPERALVVTSTDGGDTWSDPVNGARSGDRPDFPAIAISPDGADVYLVYDNFLQPWQSDTSNPRLFGGIVRHAAATDLSSWATPIVGLTGDARASSLNSLVAEFLGDYNSIVATNEGFVATWNDAHSAVDCVAVDNWRSDPQPDTKPSPDTDCDPSFGDTNIVSP